MRTYIHGTSYENAMNILKNGFSSEDKNIIWECSNPYMIYLRDKYDEDDDSLMLCIESGQIAAAKTNSLSTKIGIIEIEMPRTNNILDYGEKEREKYFLYVFYFVIRV